MQPELPLYTIKRSARAKRVHLKVTPSEGLVVTLPRNYILSNLEAVFEEKHVWISEALLWARDQRSGAGRGTARFPGAIDLRALRETWKVDYLPGGSSLTRVVENGERALAVHGALRDRLSCGIALKKWLRRKARLGLVPMLELLAVGTGMDFGRAVIGSQKTLWGSCSLRKTISLNQKLLFLPEDLVRYVLIHELCHTVHLDHSPRFWSLVESFRSDYREQEEELKGAGRLVPAWAE